MNLLFQILSGRQQKHLFLIIFLILVSALLDVLGIGIIVPILTIILNEDLSTIIFLAPILEFLNFPSQEYLIVYAMILLMSVFLVKTIFVTILNYIQSRYIWNIVSDFSRRVFEIYLNKPYAFHLDTNSSKLISNTHNEVNQVANGVIGNLIFLITDLILAVSIVSLLIFIQPLGILIVTPLLFLFVYVFLKITKRYVKSWGESRQEFDQIRMKHLNQGLHGIKEVKIYGKEKYFETEYSQKTKQYSEMRTLENFIQKAPSTFIELIGALGISLLIIILLFTGNDPNQIIITVGVFAAAAFRLTPSVNRVASTVGGIRFSLAALNTLHKLLSAPIKYNVQNKYKKIENFNQIIVDNLGFNYSSSKTKVLKNININIKKNQTIGIIGPSGSGKSTFLDLFLGLLEPSSGAIFLDNQNIKDLGRTWQSNIGYVPQEIFMIDDSISQNIAFGVPIYEIDEKRIQNAIKLSQLEGFISELPNGLNTVIGERGARVSGGQRQRIGIARALYHDPDIIIFDEATSSLDDDTEKQLMKSVSNLYGNKTIIIISHRQSTVEDCDYIYKLKNGTVEKIFNK